MLCPTCNKESKNLRVCPYCFTPYPDADAVPGKRGSRTATGATPAVRGGAAASSAGGGLLGWFQSQTLLVRVSAIGIIAVLILWTVTSPKSDGSGGEGGDQVVATQLQRDQALAIIRQTRETALVDVQQDEVFVSYPAATFPVRDDGQLELARQFAEADAIVEGRKRRIFFYNPNGKLFAQSDPARGVVQAP